MMERILEGMHENLHLGTINRTRVGLNWSVVVIVALIASGLATGLFRNAAPGFGAGVYWTAALLTAVVFLASLLGHELSHAVVARRRGVVVEGIVLWALGGVAKLNGDAPDARSEMRIAIAGPVASVAFAAAFGVSALGLNALGASAIVVTAFAWLAEINVLLALFFIPTFPFNGIWLALIGWFIYGASRQKRGAVRINSALDGLRVGDAMHPVTGVAPAYATLDDLVEQYLRPGHVDRYPLVDFHGAIAGLVSLEQLGRVAAEHWPSTKVSEVAWPTASLAQVSSGEALAPFVTQLSSVPSHSALVFEDGRLVGTVTPRDIEQVLRSPTVFRHTDRPFATAHGE